MRECGGKGREEIGRSVKAGDNTEGVQDIGDTGNSGYRT